MALSSIQSFLLSGPCYLGLATGLFRYMAIARIPNSILRFQPPRRESIARLEASYLRHYALSVSHAGESLLLLGLMHSILRYYLIKKELHYFHPAIKFTHPYRHSYIHLQHPGYVTFTTTRFLSICCRKEIICVRLASSQYKPLLFSLLQLFLQGPIIRKGLSV